MSTETIAETWTQHTFACRICGRMCYLGQSCIDAAREDWAGPEMTDDEIATGFDACLSCEFDETVPEERVHPGAYLITPGEGFEDGEGQPTAAGVRYWAIDDEANGTYGLLVSGPVPEAYHGQVLSTPNAG